MTTGKAAAVAAMVLGLLVPGQAFAQDKGPGTLDEEIARAKAAQKPLILEFFTTWCAPCKEFEKVTLQDGAVQAVLPGVSLVRYDAEHGNGIAVAAKYRVNAYPTLLAVDETGAVKLQLQGGPSAKAFVAFLQKGGAIAMSEAQMMAELKKSPNDPRVAMQAAQWLVGHDRLTEALAKFDAAVAIDKKNAANIASAAAWQAAKIRRGLAARKLAGEQTRELVKSFPGNPEAVTALLAVSADLPAAERKTLWIKLADARSSDGNALNDLAYRALAAGELDGALDMANRMKALLAVPGAKQDPSMLDTIAEVHNYRREKDLALKFEDQAMALLKIPQQRAQFQTNRDRFAAAEFKPLDDVESEKKNIAAIWRNAGSLEPVESKERDDDPRMAEMMMYQTTLRNSLKTIGEACRQHAAGLPEAYVRVEGADKAKPAKITVLEPAANKELVNCLTVKLTASPLPSRPAMLGASGRPDVQSIPLSAK
jgi:thiol-disulfide isomerase/thioredoxin